jgi:hypothetical protein
MGKKFETHFKENERFCFLGPEEASPNPDMPWAGVTPVSTFGPQSRPNTGVAPAHGSVLSACSGVRVEART